MRVLVLHNRYRRSGGEDLVAEAEVRMLRGHGVEVLYLEVENGVAGELGVRDRVKLAVSSTWSKSSYARVLELCRQYRPHLAHVHNFWMTLSPSVHAACHDAGVPTVQSLHNFRLLCANALFLREGKVCEDCLGRAPWRGIARRCYRGSVAASAAVAAMIVINRQRDTWNKDVDVFIAPSEYARSKFVAARLPAARIFVKPNFVEDCGPALLPPSASDAVVYVGRLSEEKGVGGLLSAWAEARLESRGRLLIVGDGPAAASLEQQAATLGLHPPRVVFTGRKAHEEALRLMRESRAVAVPSICQETFGNTVVEAFCCGRPAVVSDLGALGEIVESGATGLKCASGNPRALGEALRAILIDDSLADRLGRNARGEYLARYTPQRNYEMLMHIYQFAIERAGARLPGALSCLQPAAVT